MQEPAQPSKLKPRKSVHIPANPLREPPPRRTSCPAHLALKRPSKTSIDVSRSRPWALEKPKEPEKPQVPNTFQLNPSIKFPVKAAMAAIKAAVDERLNEEAYHPEKSKALCSRLSDEIKAKVRKLQIDERYKLVAFCAIGDKGTQGIRVVSRCAWDHEWDTFASYSYENKSLFATAIVFAVYFN
eukprot:m.1649 g.1649  ORF g.1649 m.1649 type:complete len:185 (+) comp7600_c0_seq1:74-628(+)